jgi:DNA/RNA endonuclease YhcR with UshA esterase domain
LEAALRVKPFVLIAALISLLSISVSALAHHGTANYDMTKVVTVKGTVTDFQFINPHTLILFDVKNDKGVIEHWQAEATSPNHLVRTGWTKDIIKAGDLITISGFRAKNGSTVMRFQKMVLANGQEIIEGSE